MQRKIISIFTFICTLLLSACCLVACKKEAVKLDGDYVVITATKDADGKTLLAFMEELKADGELSFEMGNGMVTSLNNIANKADYSACWMLYTSDSENANEAWGIVEYEEKQYGSATLGAERLTVKEGEIYIWWYQSF